MGIKITQIFLTRVSLRIEVSRGVHCMLYKD